MGLDSSHKCGKPSGNKGCNNLKVNTVAATFEMTKYGVALETEGDLSDGKVNMASVPCTVAPLAQMSTKNDIADYLHGGTGRHTLLYSLGIISVCISRFFSSVLLACEGRASNGALHKNKKQNIASFKATDGMRICTAVATHHRLGWIDVGVRGGTTPSSTGYFNDRMFVEGVKLTVCVTENGTNSVTECSVKKQVVSCLVGNFAAAKDCSEGTPTMRPLEAQSLAAAMV